MPEVESRGEKVANIMQRLYQSRRTLKMLCGGDFAARIAPWKKLINDLDDGRGTLATGMALAQRCVAQRKEECLILVFAAVVEIIEPSEAVR